MTNQNNLKYLEMIDSLTKKQSIPSLIKLKSIFNKAKDQTKKPVDRINILITALLTSSAYEERLTDIKIRLQKIRAQVAKNYDEERREIISKKSFLGSAKKDQDLIVEDKCFIVLRLLDHIDSRLDMIDSALTYVRSAGFNIKTVMATLKEYLNTNEK